MLGNDDVLEAIDLNIYYLGSNASVAEHGIVLQSVNKYELCAENKLPQSEWWPFVHCMYGLQACLSYTEENKTMTCTEAESGVDDDLAISGTDTDSLSRCVCTLEGAVDYCTTEHTSTDLRTLRTCEKSTEADEYYKTSNAIAIEANDGDPLWVNVNGVTYKYATNETADGLASWATSVLSVTCQAIQSAGATELPSSCDSVIYSDSSATPVSM